jgi:membrane-associated phospholipid phosphatase
MPAIQKWLSALTASVFAVFVSYEWLDRPVALFAHDRTIKEQTYAALTHIPDLFAPVAVLVFLIVGFAVFSERPLLCSISVIVASAAKGLLKFAFGRTWPETWVGNNPSFIHDGVYGFNPFHGGLGYMSFPSGHLSVTCAVASVLWIAYPKFRPLYALVVLAVSVGLIGADYHFLSDVIAGGFVGTTIGWMLMAMWRVRETAPPKP